MRDQTCARLLEIFRVSGGSPGSLVNRQTLIRVILILAILLTGGYWMVSKGLAYVMAPDSDDPGAAAVLVASRYTPAFSLISHNSVTVKTFPAGFVPPGALHAQDELLDSGGRPLYVSPVPLPEGQPLTRALLVEIGKSRGMASLLPPGKVAVSFAVDRVRGVGGWIQPGDRIAIYQTPENESEDRSARRVRLLFPAAMVLAVDKTSLREPVKGEEKDNAASFLDMPEETGAVLTVLLNTFEAEPFIEAMGRGRLTAALRAIGDELNEPSQ